MSVKRTQVRIDQAAAEAARAKLENQYHPKPYRDIAIELETDTAEPEEVSKAKMAFQEVRIAARAGTYPPLTVGRHTAWRIILPRKLYGEPQR